MQLVWKLALVIVAGVALVACGGGGGGDGDSADQDAIEQLMRDLGAGLSNSDADTLAALFSTDCTDAADDASAAVDVIGDAELEIDVTSVDVKNLNDDSAEALAKGTINIDGESTSLEEGADYTPVIKEDGEWKIGDCGLLES